jgi:hypothetical protein
MTRVMIRIRVSTKFRVSDGLESVSGSEPRSGINVWVKLAGVRVISFQYLWSGSREISLVISGL